MIPPKDNKVLFISHMANLSGAPLLLLEIVRTVKTKTSIKFEIIIVNDGPLSKDFEELGKVHYWNPVKSTMTNGLLKPILFRLNKWRTSRHRKKIVGSVSSFDIIFMNTITNGQVQRELLPLNARHICYAHEMDAGIHFATTRNDLDSTLKHTDFFIACSHAVRNNLVRTYGVPGRNIRVLQTPVRQTVENVESLLNFKDSFKREQKISDTTVIIGVVGAGEWRKGFDFFFPLIALYTELYPNQDVRFLWKGVGSSESIDFLKKFDYDNFNMSDKVLLLPHGNDALKIISCLDIHLLLAREDPYPLVVLESASLGIPTICFAGSGGASEFIESDSGYTVPYGNLLLMANRIHELVTNKSLRVKFGINAKTKVSQRHSFEIAITPFLDLLQMDPIDYFNSKKPILTVV